MLWLLAVAAAAQAALPEAEVLGVSVSGTGAQTTVQVNFRYRDADGDALSVNLEASSDDGASWGVVPVNSLTGDRNVSASGAWQQGALAWAAGVDWPNQVSSQMRVRVVVQDGGGAGDYAIVDISGGPGAGSYPVSYQGQAPADLLTNNDYRTSKIVLRRITAGAFTMGSPAEELGHESDEDQHEVTLTEDFYIGVFEVTQAQYENVTGDDPSYYKGSHRPVEKVSWNDIRGGTWPGDPPGSGEPDSNTFIGLLRQKTGLAFDLPTEAQWEYACRAGTTTSLNSGENITATSGECPNMNEVGRYYYNRDDGKGGYDDHTTVGSYQPNAWGLYDMHGNVWEWCLDWYADYPLAPVTDPLGGATGSYRVLRGGSWGNLPHYCRSANRNNYDPTYRRSFIGFRVLCAPAEEF